MKRKKFEKNSEKSEISISFWKTSEVFFMIAIMIIATISFAVFLSEPAEAQDNRGIVFGCCEKLKKSKEGAQGQKTCQYVEQRECESGFHPGTKCEYTTECKDVCCLDTATGNCMLTGKLTCKNPIGEPNGGRCDSGVCEKVCCVIGNQVRFTTRYDCHKHKGVIDESITNEEECRANFKNKYDKGCCSVNAPNCVYTTKESCKNTIKEGNLEEGDFSPNVKCSQVGKCECKSHERKGCWKDDKGNLIDKNIHYFDSCGNEEGIAKTCDPDEVCKQEFPEDEPECASSMCGTHHSGESWCSYMGNVGESKDVPGSDSLIHKCVNGKEVIAKCPNDKRREVCFEQTVNGKTHAKCIGNFYRQCFNAKSKSECDKLQWCYWFGWENQPNFTTISGISEDPFKGITSSKGGSSYKVELKDVAGFELGRCLPNVPLGLDLPNLGLTNPTSNSDSDNENNPTSEVISPLTGKIIKRNLLRKNFLTGKATDDTDENNADKNDNTNNENGNNENDENVDKSEFTSTDFCEKATYECPIIYSKCNAFWCHWDADKKLNEKYGFGFTDAACEAKISGSEYCGCGAKNFDIGKDTWTLSEDEPRFSEDGKNRPMINPEWVMLMADKCAAMGDCGAKPNLAGKFTFGGLKITIAYSPQHLQDSQELKTVTYTLPMVLGEDYENYKKRIMNTLLNGKTVKLKDYDKINEETARENEKIILEDFNKKVFDISDVSVPDAGWTFIKYFLIALGGTLWVIGALQQSKSAGGGESKAGTNQQKKGEQSTSDGGGEGGTGNVIWITGRGIDLGNIFGTLLNNILGSGGIIGGISAAIALCSSGDGLSWAICAVIAVILIGIVFFSWAFIRHHRIVVYGVECLPWQPPVNSKDCGRCKEIAQSKDKDAKCTEYLCHSLGQNCMFINANSPDAEDWDCVDYCKINNDVSPPEITSASVISINNKKAAEKDYIFDEYEKKLTITQKVEVFKPIVFNLTTNERALCRPARKNEEVDLNTSGFFKLNHRLIIVAQSRDDKDFYVLCKDVCDNKQGEEEKLVIHINKITEKDLSPPMIIKTSLDGAYVPNIEKIDVTIFVDEPINTLNLAQRTKECDELCNDADYVCGCDSKDAPKNCEKSEECKRMIENCKANCKEIGSYEGQSFGGSCKWDYVKKEGDEEKSFDDLNFTLKCPGDPSFGLCKGQICYTCDTTLKLKENNEEYSKFVFRCKDASGNIGNSKVLELNRADKLLINHIEIEKASDEKNYVEFNDLTEEKENENIEGNFSLIVSKNVKKLKLRMKITTTGGYDSGGAICYYNTKDNFDKAKKFDVTGKEDLLTNEHSTNLTLSKGKNTIYLWCYDSLGDSTKTKTIINIEQDKTAPKIIRMWNENGMLRIKTDENCLKCYYAYDEGTCENENKLEAFGFEEYCDGNEFSASVGNEVWIRCSDKWQNLGKCVHVRMVEIPKE